MQGTKLSDPLHKSNNLVAMAEVFITSNLRLGVAYDFNLNGLTKEFSGGIEASLGYYIMTPRKYYSTPRHIMRKW
jgi:hypothetical protein